MATKLWQTLLKKLPLSRKRHRKSGFTLIELLVTVLISAVIITALLSFVVDLLQTDRREYARSETQREMETALNFIVDDLREAVYIYERIEQERPNAQRLQNFLPSISNPGAETPIPVLAFWKAQRLNDVDLPPSCDTNDAECNQVLIRRRAYSLVVYYIAENPPNDPKWRGKARIIRYSFNKYPNLPSLNKSSGYRDPAEESTFENWPYINGSPQGNATTGDGSMQAVLVDFVDDPQRQLQENQVETCRSSDPNSPFYSTDPTNNPTYRRIPTEISTSNSFYVCVKTLGTVAGTNQQEKLNQDVILFLRGNPVGRVNANDRQPLLTVRAGAIARGVIDKKP